MTQVNLENQKNRANQVTRADLILLAIVMFCVPFVYQSFWHNNAQATHAQILVADQQHQHLDLTQDQTLNIAGARGSSKLEVNNGRIRFIDSPCKARYCIRQNWLQQSGAVIACLPNKVAVQLTAIEPEYDSLNF